MKWIKQYNEVLLYGAAIAILSLLLKVLEWKVFLQHYSFEVYAGILAVMFTMLGIWLARKMSKPEVKIEVVPINEYILNEQAIDQMGLSKRELEVLNLLSQGLSNAEIADRLFVSPNTIKTHVTRVFEKLEVNNRTKAVAKAKELRIIR
jgi:two-component system, NarL family, response regulator LiaR